MSNSRTAGPSGSAVRRTKTIEVEGKKFKIPAKMPFAAMQYLTATAGATEVVGLLTLLLGEEQLQQVWDLGLDLEQGTQLVKDISNAYGVKAGESAASPSS